MTEFNSLSDPDSLRDHEDIPVEGVDRVLDREQFEALKERYEHIDGVVQIGVTTEDGRLLLQSWGGSADWAPPGGQVEPGEDWVEAARAAMADLTGVAIEIDDIVLLEHLNFSLAGEERSFSSYGVSFAASLAEEDSEFAADPTPAEDREMLSERDIDFRWVESVPDDANENHIDHIEQFLP